MDVVKSEKKQSPWIRVLLLVAFLALGFVLVAFTPVGAYLKDLPRLQAQIQSFGAWGYIVFILVYALASLLNIPGTAFLVLSVLMFGYLNGALLTYGSSVIGAMLTFYFGRLIGGKGLKGIKNIRVKRLLAKAENYPIRSIVLLRALIQLSPLVGYTLALTQIQARSYFIGNLIGNLLPVAYMTLGLLLFKDQLIALLGIQL